MTEQLNDGKNLSGGSSFKYGLLFGCVIYNSRDLLGAGVLNANAFLPVTASLLLNAELALRQAGIWTAPFIKQY